jgi:hypothetical protein
MLRPTRMFHGSQPWTRAETGPAHRPRKVLSEPSKHIGNLESTVGSAFTSRLTDIRFHFNTLNTFFVCVRCGGQLRSTCARGTWACTERSLPSKVRTRRRGPWYSRHTVHTHSIDNPHTRTSRPPTHTAVLCAVAFDVAGGRVRRPVRSRSSLTMARRAI